MLADQISSMVLVLGLSQFLRRFDLTTPQALMYIRVMYITSQLLQLLAWYYVRSLVMKGKREETTTMIEVVEPAKPFSSEAPKKTHMSIRAYDLSAVSKNINSVLTGMLIMMALHFWFKMTQPLIFQSLLPWKNFFTMPVIQIRLFGWKAEGNLARPWKAPANPLAELMEQQTAVAEEKKSDDKLVKEASAAEEDDEEESKIEEIIEEEVESTSTNVKSRKTRGDSEKDEE